MPTPLKQRTRISLEDKVKLIEDSKRPGFNRKDAMEKYGIGRNAVSTILKDQAKILKCLDSGSISKTAITKIEWLLKSENNCRTFW